MREGERGRGVFCATQMSHNEGRLCGEANTTTQTPEETTETRHTSDLLLTD